MEKNSHHPCLRNQFFKKCKDTEKMDKKCCKVDSISFYSIRREYTWFKIQWNSFKFIHSRATKNIKGCFKNYKIT